MIEILDIVPLAQKDCSMCGTSIFQEIVFASVELTVVCGWGKMTKARTRSMKKAEDWTYETKTVVLHVLSACFTRCVLITSASLPCWSDVDGYKSLVFINYGVTYLRLTCAYQQSIWCDFQVTQFLIFITFRHLNSNNLVQYTLPVHEYSWSRCGDPTLSRSWANEMTCPKKGHV